jgi:hypothetical protein
MRKGRHSDGLPFAIMVALWLLSELGKASYGDLFKAWATKELTRLGYGELAVSVLSGLAELVPAITASAFVVAFLYWYLRREFERMLSTQPEKQEVGIDDAGLSVSAEPDRPLPIALSVESLASYLRTGPRPNRLDSTIARRGHVELNNGATLAYGLCERLNSLGISDIAQLDALLEEKEELLLYTATRWIFTEGSGIHRGQCVAELCSILNADLGKEPQAKRMIDDYLTAKAAKKVSHA